MKRTSLLAALLLTCLLSPHAKGDEFTFVSIPDWLNIDVGDIGKLPTYDGGPNSTSPDFEAAMDTVLDAVAAERPAFVLVAGDLTMGHWDRDVDRRQIFGPTANRTQKAAAIDTAADFYYGIWKRRFADRRLTVYPALGDHDIGDNNWEPGSDKSHLVPAFKDVFARHFTRDAAGNYVHAARPEGTAYEGTAYAMRHGNTLVVTVDVFYQRDPDVKIDKQTGTVQVTVRDGQLAWLDRLLAEANEDPSIQHVIVQGHTPVLAPVRKQRSSGLTMPGAQRTDFWKTLARHGVDLYFAGEVHDMTASNHGGVEQLAHGGLLGYADDINYLVARVAGPVIDLELKAVDVTLGDRKMWQTGSNRPMKGITLDSDGFQTAGTLRIDKSSGKTVYTNRTGRFTWHGTTPD